MVSRLALSVKPYGFASSPKGGAKGLTVTPTAAPTPETELTLSAARQGPRQTA